MTKPKAIEWLESTTGTSIDYPTERVTQERHLSVRLSSELAERVDRLAAERELTPSQFVRELLRRAVDEHSTVTSLDARALADRLAADVAEVRKRLAG